MAIPRAKARLPPQEAQGFHVFRVGLHPGHESIVVVVEEREGRVDHFRGKVRMLSKHFLRRPADVKMEHLGAARAYPDFTIASGGEMWVLGGRFHGPGSIFVDPNTLAAGCRIEGTHGGTRILGAPDPARRFRVVARQ